MLGRIISFLILMIFVCDPTHLFALNCSEKKSVCIEGPAEKIINGLKVYRDCWKYKYDKVCDIPSLNNCDKIDANKCNFVEERCLASFDEEQVKFCGNLERDFSCKREITYNETKISYDDLPGNELASKDLLCKAYCLDGNCPDAYKDKLNQNTELGEAIGQLSALGKIKAGMIDADSLNFDVFRANTRTCSKKAINYTNCCEMKGWASSIGLSHCSKDDHQLAEQKSKNKCEPLGTYCTNKIPLTGVCTVTKYVYCCFDTILSKAVHKEGRRQLGRDLGSPESPRCSGFSLEELQKIDFSKVDYSEFFEKEVIPKIKPFSQNDLNVKIQSSAQGKGSAEIDPNFNKKTSDIYKEKGL